MSCGDRLARRCALGDIDEASLLRVAGLGALCPVVPDSRPDGVLSKHYGEWSASMLVVHSKQRVLTGAVELDGRQAQLLGNLGVLDFFGLLQRQPLDTLGHIRARGDGTPASERLELDVGDDAVFIDLDLQLHDVAAPGDANRGQPINDDDTKNDDELLTQVRRPGLCRHSGRSLGGSRPGGRGEVSYLITAQNIRKSRLVETYVSGLLVVRDDFLVICASQNGPGGAHGRAGGGGCERLCDCRAEHGCWW